MLAGLRRIPDESVRTCITSPPYWGLRDYNADGQIGLEGSPDEFAAKMVEVFREVRRVLTKDGTLWLNLGDSYARSPAKGGSGVGGKNEKYLGDNYRRGRIRKGSSDGAVRRGDTPGARSFADGVKVKDLVGIPWLVAFALRADGWYLRSDIIWQKPNPMPESVKDRPTKAHEYLFLLSKSECYYYDAEAIAEVSVSSGERDQGGSNRIPSGWASGGEPHDTIERNQGPRRRGHRKGSGNLKRDIPSDQDGRGIPNDHLGRGVPWENTNGKRNARSVWTINTQPYSGAHFATFPEELPRRCILAGSAPGDTVLDPFGGSGTTGAVAIGLGRSAVLIDLNPKYVELARQRIGPMLCTVKEAARE